MVAELRKRKPDGSLYERPAAIQKALIELEKVSRDDLARRCAIRNRDDPEYVADECLMYFVRASRADNSEAHFDQLFKLLDERVLRRLPRPDSPDGETSSLKAEKIRDKVRGRLLARLSADRQTYCEKLDYFEVRFESALKRLRQTAQEEVWREENRHEMLETDEGTGELSSEVERAAGALNAFESEISGLEFYRLALDAAIHSLPREQIRIVEMIRRGIPIDSKDEQAETIAKILGNSEKTIRLWRDKAFEAVRAHLARGDE